MKNKSAKKILNNTKHIYNDIASDFDITRGKWWHILDKFKLGAKEGDNILDLGCGNGRLAQLFADCEISYLGIDVSEELIKIAKKKFAVKNNIRFEVGDILNLQLQKNNFDLVYVLAVLHHIPSEALRLKALEDINKAMKKNATLFISNWNIFGSAKYRKFLFNFAYKASQGVFNIKDAFVPWKKGSSHLRYIHNFTKNEMRNLLQKTGFDVKELYYENKGEKSNFYKGFNLVAVAKKK